MRLKSLELHGYKTFARQTLFEFAGAVTAIVGPNGSGKSNVADGLRWVLGEQTYSLMRAKRTEDMIYSGSQQRARAGMASVTVVLDNQEGWLPIDYTEVAISRRAYRDGLNEYLLNKQRVRLKDISELLGKSGLAERTYTIIGQGLVDAALALKAEERRRLFEEAAGIGLFRARREEALRRLEATHRNLDRVQDILSEIEPRLKSLERQARRAHDYEQVKSDLRILLREWHGYHWKRVQSELVDAQEAVNQKDKELEEARQSQEELANKLDYFRERIQEIRNNLSTWHRQLSELHSQREAKSRELAIIQERTRSLEEQSHRVKHSLGQLEEEIVSIQEQCDISVSELMVVESNLSESRDQARKAKQELIELQKELHEAQAAFQTTQKEHSTLLERKSHLHERLSDFLDVEKRLSTELTNCEEKIQALRKQSLNSKQQVVKMEAQLEVIRSERNEAEEKLKSCQARLDNLNSDRSYHSEALGQKRIEADRLTTKLEFIEQAEQDLIGYASGARLLLEAARNKRLVGVRGSLNSLLDVPANLEGVIASALGELLDAIIIHGESNLHQALSILDGEIARGALLPIDRLDFSKSSRLNQRIRRKLKGSNSKEIMGIAAEMVTAPEDLRPTVNFLLANILIVKDRNTAVRVLSEFKDELEGSPNSGVVTLQGEFFVSNGAIMAGKETKSGILGRERERNDLKDSLQTGQRKIEELTNKIEELDAEIAELKVVENDLANKTEQAKRVESEYQKELERLDLTTKQLYQQISWLEGQQDNLVVDIDRNGEEKIRITNELALIDDRIFTEESNLTKNKLRLDVILIDESQTHANKWETKVAVEEQAFLDLSKRVTDRKEQLKKSLNNREELIERLGNILESLADLSTKRTELLATELELNHYIEKQNSLVQPAEGELLKLETDQAEFQSAEGEARVALNLAEHHNAQARIAMAKRQETLDSLKRRIEDDFGLVDFEYSEEISGPKPLPLAGLVEQLPEVNNLSPGLEENLKRQRSLLRRIGPVNPEVQEEYREVRDRSNFLSEQLADLRRAESDIRQVIVELDKLMEKSFGDTFTSVAAEFSQIFIRLFGGGSAQLVLTDPGDLTNSGIDIEARLPGRREQGLSLLSGGERSLAAVALVFALLKVSPTPFCILDEVDAMLDENNVNRFSDLLKELSSTTQFILITHNPNTLQVADVIYGVTMGKDSSSQAVSLKMDEFENTKIVE